MDGVGVEGRSVGSGGARAIADRGCGRAETMGFWLYGMRVCGEGEDEEEGEGEEDWEEMHNWWMRFCD